MCTKPRKGASISSTEISSKTSHLEQTQFIVYVPVIRSTHRGTLKLCLPHG